MEGENRALAQSYPSLVYHHGDHRQHQIFFKISSSGPVSSESKNIPELRNKIVLYCSSDGSWLLLLHLPETETETEAETDVQLSIWSPTTRESIVLPCLRSEHQVKVSSIHEGLMSSSPTDPNCLILLLTKKIPLILYWRVGDVDRNWSEFNYAETLAAQTGKPQLYLNHLVMFDGKIYATISEQSKLAQIKVDELNSCTVQFFRKSRMPKDPVRSPGWASRYGATRSFLVSSDHHIYLVISGFEYEAVPEIRVYKFDFDYFSRNHWKPVTSLNGGAIFLGNSYSLFCPDDNKWSYIYFTSPYQSSQAMFCHRVEDERITSYLPFQTKLQEPWLSHWMILHEEKKKLCDLPQEVLAIMAGNLSSFVDYINFRCVNKFCALATIGTRSRDNPFPPCLIYKDRVNGIYNIVDYNLNRKLSFKIPKILDDYSICCSKDGWLLLRKRHECFALFNPLTMQLLPETKIGGDSSHWDHGISNFTFLGNPNSSDFFVLAMALHRCQGASQVIAEQGIERRRTFVFGSNELRRPFKQGCNSPVVSGERCYYLGRNGELAGLQWSSKGGNGTTLEWSGFLLQCPCPHFTLNYLLNCGRRLVSIFMGEEGEKSWIRVFMVKQNKWEWEEIDSLRGYSLYLSWPSSICFRVERKEMANRIYFPRFYKDGLVYYSLNTKRYHSVENQDELQKFYNTSMYMDCAWIQPSWD